MEEGVTDSEEEEDGRAVISKVARVLKGSPRVITKPQVSLTPADPNASSLIVPSHPESILGMRIVMGRMIYHITLTP